MTRITYIEHDGTRHEVNAEDGTSVMQTALDNMVPGIVGDCGGSCSCATCHAYIDPDHLARVSPPEADERHLLEGALDVEPCSRLTCQIRIHPGLEGLTVRIPVSQY
ncbi:2Fe-2S iron-sulfur cluster-binding protein [Xenophilus azovorans]|uniref:2Fe-2S iron-sulfur cluster-binding protein n=1 Tax=Xenophilus azovorans TaxID=151755 RepID=UPI00056F0ED5|nr:2Fe-2S iron-sulfur cluster-binding protein [Xenophilus azovorans]